MNKKQDTFYTKTGEVGHSLPGKCITKEKMLSDSWSNIYVKTNSTNQTFIKMIRAFFV